MMLLLGQDLDRKVDEELPTAAVLGEERLSSAQNGEIQSEYSNLLQDLRNIFISLAVAGKKRGGTAGAQLTAR